MKLRAYFVIILTACLNCTVVAQQVRRVPPISVTTFVFQPIDLVGKRRSVVVEVRAHNVSKGSGRNQFEALEIVVMPVGNRKHGVISKSLQGGLFWFNASLYRHRKSGDYLLAIEDNGGQHDHTQVYYIDSRNLEACPLFENIGIIYGDASGLPSGHVVEHSPDQYVDEKPKGFQRRNANQAEYLTRTWTYRPKTHQFLAGPYRADK